MIFVYLVAAAIAAVFLGDAMRTANRQTAGNFLKRAVSFAAFFIFLVLTIFEFITWLDSIKFSDLLKI